MNLKVWKVRVLVQYTYNNQQGETSFTVFIYLIGKAGRHHRCTLSESVLYEATAAFIRPNNEDVAYKNGTGSHPADVMCGDLSSVCGGYGWLLTADVRVRGPKWEELPRVCAQDTHTGAM